MEPLSNMDVIILIGFAISIFIAFLRGFVSEVLSVLGFFLFVVLVCYLLPVLQPWMNKYIVSKLLSQIVLFLLIMAIFYAVWIVGTDKLILRIRTSTLSPMDRLFGLIFGLLRALLILGLCFLVVKQTSFETLEKENIKKSHFYSVAKISSDIIEKLLPDNVIKDGVNFIDDMNKVDAKDKNTTKEKSEDKKATGEKSKNEKQAKEEKPSLLDQKELDKMYEKLINPDIKTEKKDEKLKNESKGYDNKEAQNLNRLIDMTTKE